ncbi:MAG: hypothetical protein AAF351_06070 [Pseudomonadota bacterium]
MRVAATLFLLITASLGHAQGAATYDHMAPEVRASIKTLIVIGGEDLTDQTIDGTYDKPTDGFEGGMAKGYGLGNPTMDIGGVTVGFPIPFLQLPAALFGGLTGATARKIQELRDEMTEDLAKADSQPLSNTGVALDVYRSLQRLPDLDSKLFAPSTPIPDNTDAILFVSINEIAIDVQKSDAILTVWGKLSLRRVSDKKLLYEKRVQYQDQASLSDWTANDNALWDDFANYARHYLGRELSADTFQRVDLNRELVPIKTNDVRISRKDSWTGSSKTRVPTLAWAHSLGDNGAYGPWIETVNEANTYYDVEIYDANRLIYSRSQISDPVHTVARELRSCGQLRWTVRPSYHVDGSIKNGQWMRKPLAADTPLEAGIYGRDAAKSPAYTQDFAVLNVKC